MATPPVPETMRSLCTFKFGSPSKWEVAELPTPKITRPTDVLVKVHAAAINPTDIGGAAGKYWPAFNIPLPFKIGYDLAGTVAAVGSGVSRLKIGDEVFCCLPFKDGDRYGTGSISEYALSREEAVILKPKNLSFVEAASIPLVALTAIQIFGKVVGGVEGKSVFVPAGLSGVGSIAAQMAKNVYGAKKVITTVSTSKVPLVAKHLGEGVVDEIIDYTKVDPVKAVPNGSVDVMMDGIGACFASRPLLKKDGAIVCCAGAPFSGRDLKNISPDVSVLIQIFFNIILLINKWRLGTDVTFDTVLMKVKGSELESIKTWIEDGKIKPVVGKVLKLASIDLIREECTRISNKKGGLGKLVIEIIAE